jgi:O-antigen/teichoic acid export membrane protein
MIVGLRGLSDAGIFAIATYVAAIMEIPQRSLTAISIPVLAKSWKDKDFANIKHVYHKSVSNLLAVGLLLFGLIWLNIENLVAFLNWISNKESGGYDALVPLIFIMGLAKLVDLATGVNGQIIGTSNFWRFDFFTNLFYIVLSIPLNYYLINHYQLIGLAYSNLAALVLYNSVRFLFLYKKFNLQPYTLKHGLFLILSIAFMFLLYKIPSPSNFVLNIAFKSTVYGLGFYGLLVWINPAPELKELVQGFLKNKVFGFLQR